MYIIIFICLLASAPVVLPEEISNADYLELFRIVGTLAGWKCLDAINAVEDVGCRNDIQFWVDSLNDYASATAINCNNSTRPNCEEKKKKDEGKNYFAAKQFDAFGRLPANLMGVNIIWLGSWEECLAVQTKERPDYSTQYCYASVGLSVPETLSGSSAFFDLTNFTGANVCNSPVLAKWTVCMPKSCSEKDITRFLQASGKLTGNSVQYCKVDCYSSESGKKGLGFWTIMCFCGFVFAVMLVATFTDYATDKDECSNFRRAVGTKCLFAFSMYTNGAELMDPKKRPGEIRSLDCIRTFTMAWIITSHVLELHLSGDNPVESADITKYLLNDAFINAYFSVDSFLFIGGLLLAYVFYRHMSERPSTIYSPTFWTLYYVHRYVRLSVPYFLLIAFGTAIYDDLTIGPVLPNNLMNTDSCRKYWWHSVLYFNNFDGNKGTCMAHTWYLAMDMQIHVVAPLLLVPLFLSRKAGCLIACCLVILSTIVNYFLILKYDFPVNYVGFFMDMYDPSKLLWFEQMLYNAPWARFLPYLVGVLTGYFLFYTKEIKIKMRWITAVMFWAGSFFTACGCIFGLYYYLQGPEFGISKFARASYHNWSKLGWGLCLAWIVVACEKNWAGPLKNFLELGIWLPFGRLTYCAFLVHFPMIGLLMSWDRKPYHFVSTLHTCIHEALPVMVLCYVFAFVWSCLFEIPFNKLEKMAIKALFGGKTKADQKNGVKLKDGNNYTNGALPYEKRKIFVDSRCPVFKL